MMQQKISVSGTLIVDSFNTKPTPDSFTLQDKGFVISGSKTKYFSFKHFFKKNRRSNRFFN